MLRFSSSLFIYSIIRISVQTYARKKRKNWNKIYLFDYNIERKKIIFTQKIEIIKYESSLYALYVLFTTYIYIYRDARKISSIRDAL